MKLGSIIKILSTQGSPWNTAIRNQLSRKKFKTQASTWKVMLTVFWNSERVVVACRLSWKRNNNKISTLHWNSYCIKMKNRTDWNKKWNTSSTRQRHASHKCSNKRCDSTPGLFSAAASTV